MNERGMDWSGIADEMRRAAARRAVIEKEILVHNAMVDLEADLRDGVTLDGVTVLTTLAEVDALAARLHEGQTDKGGVAYIEHPRAVAAGLQGQPMDLQMAGLLHDVIEDCGVTGMQLRQLGVPRRVVELVEAVTNDPSLTYREKIQKITADPFATLLKISDNAHNSREDRAARLDGETRQHLRDKYSWARRTLWAAAPAEDVERILELVNPALLPELYSGETPED